MNADEVIHNYILLRNHKEQVEARHKEELAPIVAAMTKYEERGSALLIEQSGGDEGKANIVTPAGTMYRKRWTQIKVADRATFFTFVTQDWNARSKFLTSAVAKKEIEEFIETEKAIPPGLDIARGYSTLFNSPK